MRHGLTIDIALTPLQLLLARRWKPQWICKTCRRVQGPWRALTTATAHPAERDKPYYVTTPIFYVNAAPHVGHMYTMILADVLKRWQTLKGRKTILLTGTDEHGMKIQRAAAKAATDPKEFCDRGAEVFQTLSGQVNMANDMFIRTTDKRHVEGVAYAWEMLQARGHIYASKHEGWYSVSDETFYPDTQVQLIVDPPTGRKIMASIETGKEVEWTSERNYHFRLSAFQDKLLQFYKENPDYIVPKTRMNDVIQEVAKGLEDLSISRPSERLSWGIPVPTDSSQTVYVWLDALLNYATAVGYPFVPGQESTSGWQPDVQVIGKDIVRFHCIYWPAFQMALDLPLHKRILTHAHWTLGKRKMAKSTGNVVNPFFALERFGIDVMRWYLIHEGGIADDADYDNSFVIDKYKKSLKGGLGNLVSRLMRGKGWDVPRAVRRYAHPDTPGQLVAITDQSDPTYRLAHALLCALSKRVDSKMRDLLPNRALQEIMNAVYSCNAFFQKASPWSLTTQIRSAMADTTGAELRLLDEENGVQGGQSVDLIEARIDLIIYLSVETIRIIGILLQPFMPTAASSLLDMLGVAPDRRGFEWAVEGIDNSYGLPLVEDGKRQLFPPLTSDF